MLNTTEDATLQRHLTDKPSAEGSDEPPPHLASTHPSQAAVTRAPESNEVLSAHSTIATLVTTRGGIAVFGVKHYLRYAIISRTRGNPPQKEWRISIDEAESQMARFTEETEGSITAVITAHSKLGH